MSRSEKIRIPAFFISFILTFSLVCAPLSASALYDLPADVIINAPAAMLVSLGPTQAEDVMLFERAADTQRSSAALVRIMVGAVAIKIIREKNLDMDTTTGTYTNTILGTGLTNASMKNGEVWTLRDLLSVSMIHTAADACVTMAVTLCGSEAQFVAEMNAVAAQIGCKNTSFANVTGLDNINQYTTARDIYLMMRFAMDYPEFEPLISAMEYTCHPVSGGNARTLANPNDMMRASTPYYYASMSFGKTGFTDQAGRCLASVAQDSGYEYLCIVLGCPNTDADGNAGLYFKDTKALYRWAFNNFTYKTLLNKNEPVAKLKVNLAWNKDTVTLVPEINFATTVANDLDLTTIRRKETLVSDSVDAPITKGQVYGKVELFINVDQKIGEVNLVANESIESSQLLSVWEEVQKFLSSPWFYGGLILLGLLFIGYIILNIVYNNKRKHKHMKRIKKYR